MATRPTESDYRKEATLRFAAYCAASNGGDVTTAPQAALPWTKAIEQALRAGQGDLQLAAERLQRRSRELGSGFRLTGEAEERGWPVSPLPLPISADEWRHIASGVAQRARLIDLVLADIYGAQRLAKGGAIPPALVTGSADYLRQMMGMKPPGGHHMRIYAAELGRDPDGTWRVLADHSHAPVGLGYALENRLAASGAFGGLQTQLHVERLAPFFAAWRRGLEAGCARREPRLAVLTPGRFNQSYAEQAHLARYLGLLLVEGADLAVHDARLYLRTIEGLKQVDGVWQRMAAALVDPLALDSASQIGVPGLIDAVASGEALVANLPGCGVVESRAFAAFLPRLAVRLTGEELRLPNIATWWCGQPNAARHVGDNFESMLVARAFSAHPLGLGGASEQMVSTMPHNARRTLQADMARRPMDYVGQEVVHLSTMPMLEGGQMVPRPFTLRVFAAIDEYGEWTVMPGGFLRIGDDPDVRAANLGEGAASADVIVLADAPVAPVTLMRGDGDDVVRRNPGTLPSRVADNLFWLGRYLERSEAVLALVRLGLGGGRSMDNGGPLSLETEARLSALLGHFGAPGAAACGTSTLYDLSLSALGDPHESQSVYSQLRLARGIADGSRERLSADFWTLLDAPFPSGGPLQCVARLQERLSALSGQASEHMGRTAGWRFHDLGRRIERALSLCRAVRAFGGDNALPDDLALLLELGNMRITYRQRYPTGLSRARVRDLVGLDPYNPRAIVFQITEILAHLAAFPRLHDNGMAEAHQNTALALQARMAMLDAQALSASVLLRLEEDLTSLSDAIAERFFLRGASPKRAARMVFA